MSYKRLFNIRARFGDSNGTPVNGGLIFVFLAGSSTRANTYNSSIGGGPNSNPLVTDSAGYLQSEVWVTAGLSYKIQYAAPGDGDSVTPPSTPIWTEDNVTGINDSTTAVDEWQAGPTPTYVSGTSFTLVGDQTSTFAVGRRVKVVDSGGTKYATITVSAFTALTTVTVSVDIGSLASPISSVSYGLLSPINVAIPAGTSWPASVAKWFDSIWRMVNSVDATKVLAFALGAITTATTRTRYISDEDAPSAMPWEVQNLTLVATVGSNALTVAVKTKNGTDPSATDPIIFKFRNSTAATGDYTSVTLTAALSLVISSGSTLGTASGQANRIRIGVANDAGTLRLFAYNSLLTQDIFGFDEARVQTSVAEGGAGAADSAQTLYSGTAFTSKAIRMIGFVESTQATAGTWATSPSRIQLTKFGDRVPGDVIQLPRSSTAVSATGTTTIPGDNTIPQITEGDQYLTQAITPTFSGNVLEIESHIFMSNSASVMETIALFQDASANALAACGDDIFSANANNILTLRHRMIAGTGSATTFRIRAGGSGAGTSGINTRAATQMFNGVANSDLVVREYEI